MRFSALITFLCACACGPPPTISLRTSRSGSPTTITARVTNPSDGRAFVGEIVFAASTGQLSPTRVQVDSNGIATASLTATASEVTVTATAGGATELLRVNLRPPAGSTGDDPLPAPAPYLTFRTSPGATRANTPLRPAPAVELVGLKSGSSGLRDEVLITLSVTSCSATLDPQSQLTAATLSGIAIFENVSFTTPATGCQLVATSTGARYRESDHFDVLP